jgi:hypothetical protein
MEKNERRFVVNKRPWWLVPLTKYTKRVKVYFFVTLLTLIGGSQITFYFYFNQESLVASFLLGVLSTAVFIWSFLRFRLNAKKEFQNQEF